ncbi:hypothetical protein HZP82_04575 [Elizabethkingia anophelis]|nr:hypothetical protein [Elizabethkingia anophelis]MCT4104523.1 hypothetical protein [Elizabethkingia anophelis]
MLVTKDKITIAISILALIISIYNAVKDWIRSLPNFDTTYFITGLEGVDDEIVLYNKSTKKITISYFELYSVNNFVHREIDLGLDGKFILITIAPNEYFRLRIPDQFKFKPKDALYFKVKLMGKEDIITIPIFGKELISEE